MASMIPAGPEGAQQRIEASQWATWREQYGDVGADGEFLRTGAVAGVAVDNVTEVSAGDEAPDMPIGTNVATVAEQRNGS